MKAYIIVTFLAVSALSSVSSAFCMKRFMSSQGLQPNSNTNFYAQAKQQGSVNQAQQDGPSTNVKSRK